MISIDTLAIGTPVAIFVIIGFLALVEYCLIERAKRCEQLAVAGREKPSGRDPAQAAANPGSTATAKTQTAAE
jgi:hypothetical protein